MVSYKKYRTLSQKNTPQVFFDYILRKVSHPVSYGFLILRVSPNQVGVMSTIFSVVAGCIIVSGYPTYGFLVFLISYLFDFCDGNIARVIVAIEGIPEVRKRKGLLLESLNTNISLLVLYISLGIYFSLTTGNILFVVFAFFVFGIKIISRYSIAQGSSIFKDFYQKDKKFKNVNERFSNSITNKIKFFISKTFFSLNFYLPIYLFSFVFIPIYVQHVFILYAFLDVVVSISRLLRVFFRNY
jgi:hypothetical protein